MATRASVHWYVVCAEEPAVAANIIQEAFKAIVDGFTPKNWKQACMSNLDKPAFPEEIEPAGYRPSA